MTTEHRIDGDMTLTVPDATAVLTVLVVQRAGSDDEHTNVGICWYTPTEVQDVTDTIMATQAIEGVAQARRGELLRQLCGDVIPTELVAAIAAQSDSAVTIGPLTEPPAGGAERQGERHHPPA